jgi:uncharacterized protein YodC (DUF2158 family)
MGVLMQFEIPLVFRVYENHAMSLQRSKAETEQFERGAIIAALSWLCDPLRTMENLQGGEVVQLKSGGPLMTIKHVESDGTTYCHWFDNQGELKHGTFKREQLKKAEHTPNEGGGGPEVRQR